MNTLILNLERYVRLSCDDRSAMERLKRAALVQVPARSTVISEGDEPKVVRLMLSGWAYRFKDLPDGRRQIVGFFISGDFCDLNVYILRQMDFSIGTLTPVSYYAIPPAMLEELVHERPRVGQALLWQELVASSVHREWLLNLGQRTALERLAHMFVELYVRLRVVGLTRDHECDFPLTQNDLADAAGITAVHLNRTLQELRREGLVELRAKRLHIPDLERLKQVAMFNPNYLHLDHEGRHLDASD
jgi:CRP-like cAMP-binding protein